MNLQSISGLSDIENKFMVNQRGKRGGKNKLGAWN